MLEPAQKTMRWKAPGKMFWIGEYAVLYGYSAVIAAVDRYATASYKSVRSDNKLHLTSNIADAPLVVSDTRTLKNQKGVWALIAHTAATLEKGAQTPKYTLPAGHISFDSSSLSEDTKLGLGSSGAIGALAAVTLQPNRNLSPVEIEHIAMNAHHRFQGGVGSGGDIIASIWGGLRELRDQKHLAVPIPDDLYIGALYTGTSANTRKLVRRVDEAYQQIPVVRDIITSMGQTADKAVEALRNQQTGAWLASVTRYHEYEVELTEATQAPIVNPPVQRCVTLAQSAGCVAKASGAGGGDIVLVMSDDEQAIDTLKERALDEEMSYIPLDLATEGLKQIDD